VEPAHADGLGRWAWWIAIGRSSGELFLDDGRYVVDTNEDVPGLDICDGRRGSELSLGRNRGVKIAGCALA
jgi:hypothetical protein